MTKTFQEWFDTLDWSNQKYLAENSRSIIKGYNKDGKETNYYYMIRETGGYMSGAYVDGREGNRNNPYVKSNVGSESYILELGYITSEHDLNLIDHHNTEYLQAVSDAISSYLLHK